VHFHKVALIGVGLLGGSIGLALRQRRLADACLGFVRREASVAECGRLGVVDRAATDLRVVVQDADLIIFCTPIAQMRAMAEQCLPVLKAGALVTDVGSVKGSVVAELEPLFSRAGACFVGSHPMAGAEKTGPAAARANLFEGAVCVVTPSSKSPAAAVQQVEAFWTALGGRSLRLTPDQHDSLVARSSHLPHVVAAELANYVLSPAHPAEQPALCATGFRDTTRIASGSPEMWRDIALGNRKHLARALGVFIEDLQEFQLALERGDTAAVDEFFETAKHRRDQWLGNGHSPE
jgi:prephenate dehydrogenase